MIDQSIIDRASRVNILDICADQGIPIKEKKAGREYVLAEHDSCHISSDEPYKWYRFSESTGGDAIEFCKHFLGMSFVEAVEYLSKLDHFDFDNVRIAKALREITVPTPLGDDKLKLAGDCRRVIAYLTRTRSINYNIVLKTIKECGLAQQERFGNCVFPVYDNENILICAELHGTSSMKRFKSVCGTQGAFGFKWKLGSEVKSICFFESGIDLLSFIDYYTNIDKGKPLKDVMCVSMCGPKPQVVHTYTELYPNARGTLCVDADDKGREFSPNLKHFEPPVWNGNKVKDWNDLIKLVRGGLA